MSKGVAFGADSGTVALALATGEATMVIPESVKVTFKGNMQNHMDFRDVVHATQAQMLKKYGENVFQGRIIEVHIGTLLADQAFTFIDWTAEMKAKASICISQDKILIDSLKIAKKRIQIMIDKGMDNENNIITSSSKKYNNYQNSSNKYSEFYKRKLRKKMNNLFNSSAEDKLKALNLAEELADKTTLPILRRGLKDMDPEIVERSADLIRKFK
jgi:hypothetical protein